MLEQARSGEIQNIGGSPAKRNSLPTAELAPMPKSKLPKETIIVNLFALGM